MIEDVLQKLQPQTRTPRNYDSIEKGALALDLKERVELNKKLKESIDHELQEMRDKLKEAEEVVNVKTT